MLTCENCIHSCICTPYNTPNDEYPNIGDCPHFKDKANLVEVVRCGDCKKGKRLTENGIMVFCYKSQSYRTFSDFCSYGEERKDNNA